MIAALTGTIGATIAMVMGPLFAESPDFWGLALWIGITAAALIVLSTAVEDDRFAPAPAFCCYAAVFFWWIATGLDNFVPDGKGPHTAAAVTSAITDTPLAAGTGAFGGLLSMSWSAVAISVFLSLVCGALLGLASVKLAGVFGKVGTRSSRAGRRPCTPDTVHGASPAISAKRAMGSDGSTGAAPRLPEQHGS